MRPEGKLNAGIKAVGRAAKSFLFWTKPETRMLIIFYGIVFVGTLICFLLHLPIVLLCYTFGLVLVTWTLAEFFHIDRTWTKFEKRAVRIAASFTDMTEEDWVLEACITKWNEYVEKKRNEMPSEWEEMPNWHGLVRLVERSHNKKWGDRECRPPGW